MSILEIYERERRQVYICSNFLQTLPKFVFLLNQNVPVKEIFSKDLIYSEIVQIFKIAEGSYNFNVLQV